MSDVTLDLSKVIALRTPISYQNQKIEDIHLRPPRAAERRRAEGHLRNGMMPENTTRYQISLIAAVSGLNEAVIEQMDVDQFEEASDYLTGFSTRGQKIGPT